MDKYIIYLYNGKDLKLGDVCIDIRGDKVVYYRFTINADGVEELMPIAAENVQDKDYESDRGDVRRQ